MPLFPDPPAPLYQDEWLLVFDKPSGLLSVPGRGIENADNLTTRVQQCWTTALNVHRLDRDTSGLIVLALDPETHRRLGRLFELRQVGKCYEALVYGSPNDEAGVIELPLIKDWPNRPLQKVDHQHGLTAVTHWRCLQRYPRVPILDQLEVVCSRCELRPTTGRSHQLRVHLQQLGHPILGDDLYAHDAARTAAPRLCLHACELSFVHPWTGEQCRFISTTPF